MAKKAIALNMAALAAIVAAGENGTFGPIEDTQPLADAGLVEINMEVTDGHNNPAVRATAKGIAEVPAQTAPTKAKFEIVAVPTDIVEAANSKRRASRGNSEKYPFSSLEEAGQGFFVSATEKMPDPAASLASTVSSATSRFATEQKDEAGEVVTETVTVKVYAKNEEGKRFKGEDGKFVVAGEEEVTRPVMENTRVFKLVSAEGGAWVIRTA